MRLDEQGAVLLQNMIELLTDLNHLRGLGDDYLLPLLGFFELISQGFDLLLLLFLDLQFCFSIGLLVLHHEGLEDADTQILHVGQKTLLRNKSLL